MTGKALPTQEELQEWEEQGNSAAGGDSSIKGVPYFWLTVLCNQVCSALLQASLAG